MARVTIIPSDTTVYVGDTWIEGIDMTGVPENIHALQWNWNDSGVGEIEFNDGSANEVISELPDWAVTCQERYTTKKLEIEAEEAAIAAAEEEARLLQEQADAMFNEAVTP